MNTQKDSTKKKSNRLGGIIAVIFVFLAGLANSGMNENILSTVVVGVVFVGIVIAAARSGAKKKKGAAPSAKRHPRERKDVPPLEVPQSRGRGDDAYCVVCENTGEDHFAHDKAERIKQLDDFLKNGIIDKNEYRIIRERYKNDI